MHLTSIDATPAPEQRLTNTQRSSHCDDESESLVQSSIGLWIRCLYESLVIFTLKSGVPDAHGVRQ